ncbi:MAG: hypothetical protein AAF221_01020 [Pseudomonadota bacterium]
MDIIRRDILEAGARGALRQRRPKAMSDKEIIRRITTLGYTQDLLIEEWRRRGRLKFDHEGRPIIPDYRPSDMFFFDHGYDVLPGEGQ